MKTEAERLDDLSTESIHPDGDDVEAELRALAALSPAEYGRSRRDASKRLGIPLKFLDEERERRRKAMGGRDTEADDGCPPQGRPLELHAIEPADEPVEGAPLLTELITIIRRFVVMSVHQAVAVALWILRTHAHDCFDFNPRLFIQSPTKGCGKTTLQEVIEPLVPRPLLTSNATPAAIFRAIEEVCPTLLVDECESFIAMHEELRGILNSGHRRAAAQVIRTVGDAHEPRVFSTWCPMAVAAIGRLPDTLESRSIIIKMQRKRPSDTVLPLRWTGKAGAANRETLDTLARRCARWAQDHEEMLWDADPCVPDQLQNRMADNWASLLAIADAISGDWPKKAREAASELSGRPDMDVESIGVQLLGDIRAVFQAATAPRLSSQDLCDRLAALEERPWGEWRHNKPLSQPQLAKLLKSFEITSISLRLPPDNRVARGYEQTMFLDAWARYSPPRKEDGRSKRYSATDRASGEDEPLRASATDQSCSTSENSGNPAPGADCNAVADQTLEATEEFICEGDSAR